MSLARKMAGVGLTQIVEFGLQLLTPVVLVRLLDADVFASYRWLLLLVGTMAAIAPLGMIISLFYFLPRVAPRAKLQFILQAAAHLFLMACLLAGGAWVLRAYLPGEGGLFTEHGLWLMGFAVAWVVGVLLDQLPTADERVLWQMVLSIGLIVVRTLVLVWVAWRWQSLAAILYALCAFVLLKLALLAWYAVRFHRQHDWQRGRLKEHVAHAWPLGLGALLFNFRRQLEQWLVAAMFTPLQFAAFSIAAALAPVMVMARKSVGLVLMPGMSRAQDRGDLQSMLKVNQAGNLVVTAFMSPLLAVVAVYADVLVVWAFTDQYQDVANVLRVFVALWFLQMIDFNALVVMLSEGGYVSRINAPLLVLALAASYVGAKMWGLPGAALGSVVTTYIERILLARRLALRLNTTFYRVQPWRATVGMSVVALASCLACRWGATALALPPLVAMMGTGVVFGFAGLLMAKKLVKELG